MPDKIYLTANELLLDSFRLGQQVLAFGWRPDVILALWRGGTPVSLAIHELLAWRGLTTRHLALYCHSYAGIGQAADVVIENGAETLARLPDGARVLVVDDIFDSGRTASAVLALLRPRAAATRLAALYWKTTANRTALRPDYYLRQTSAWVVFPHELEGLTPAEIRQKDAEIYR
jgi:hypoxanthine phosphoribosyltransferase